MCAPGFRGRACGECEPGYFRSDNDCKPCPKYTIGMLVGVAVLALVVAALFLALGGRRQAKAYGGTISIGIKFFQVLMVVSQMDVRWPRQVKDALTKVSAVVSLKLDVLGMECANNKMLYEVKWAVTVLLPVFFLVVFALLFAALWLWFRVARSRPVPRTLADRMINAYLSIFSIGYLTLVSTALEPLVCTRDLDGNWSSRFNPGKLCASPWWYKIAPAAAVASIVYVVAVPAALTLFLRRNREALSGSASFATRYGGLFTTYRRDLAHFWEPLVMLEKILIAATGLFLAAFPMLQALLLLLLLFFTLSVYQSHEPYARPDDNRLHTVLRWCCILVLAAGLLFRADQFPSLTTQRFFEGLAIALVVAGTATVALAMFHNLWSIRRAMRKSLSKDLEALLGEMMTPFGRAEVVRWLTHSRVDWRGRLQGALEAIKNARDLCKVPDLHTASNGSAASDSNDSHGEEDKSVAALGSLVGDEASKSGDEWAMHARTLLDYSDAGSRGDGLGSGPDSRRGSDDGDEANKKGEIAFRARHARARGSASASHNAHEAPLLFSPAALHADGTAELSEIMLDVHGDASEVGDEIVATFTGGVLRAGYLPLVRRWLLDGPNLDLGPDPEGARGDFLRCFTALCLARQQLELESPHGESLSVHGTAACALAPRVGPLLKVLYGPTLAALVSNGGGAVHVTSSRWRDALQALHLANH